MVKAVYKEKTLILQDYFDLTEGEIVDVEINRGSIVDKLYGSFSITDIKLIEEIAESDELE
jgi:predicted DNA-binding antitoxin AbrB/MazE fold protein